MTCGFMEEIAAAAIFLPQKKNKNSIFPTQKGQRHFAHNKNFKREFDLTEESAQFSGLITLVFLGDLI